MLTPAKLKNELMNLGLYDNEAAACQTLADAFSNYFADAMSNGVPIAAGALPAAKAAMAAALVGMSVSGAGAAKIQAGIIAYWGAVIPAVAWPTTLLITPPPGLGTIAASLTAIFAANVAGQKSKSD